MPITNLSAIWNNNIVFTNFDEAAFGAKCPTNSKRIFYMWDLDWQHYKYNRPKMLEMLNKCDFLYARSEEHIYPIESFFGRSVDGINEDFNIEEFYKL